MISLGSLRCLKATAVIQWRGAWTCDVDLDPDTAPSSAADVPTGAQTLSVTTGSGAVVTMQGTVDPDAGGRWVAGIPLRLVAGGNGWDQPVSAQSFDSSSGVSSLTVETATAAEVGETVNDPQPTSLGLHWSRMAGPASRIFNFPRRDYYVDLAGVTQVGTWPAAVADPSVQILDWDPLQQRATLTADAVVLPGTVLPTDPRLDGPFTVRDVEIVFSREGTRITAWCSSTAVARLVSALTNMVQEFAGIAALKSYAYRIASQTGALLNLQAIDNADGTSSGAPDTKSVQVWPGMQGLSATYLESSSCRVIFLGQDFSNPIVVSFDGQLPPEVTIDATDTVHVGPSSKTVELGGGSVPVSGVGDTVYVVGAFVGTVNALPATGVVTGLGTIISGSGKVGRG